LIMDVTTGVSSRSIWSSISLFHHIVNMGFVGWRRLLPLGVFDPAGTLLWI